jgi:endoglucanase
VKRLLLTALVAGCTVVVTIAAMRSSDPDDRQPDPDDAATVTARFLDDYVDADGRVVRHDQGGDTVSEGQAYAMLLTVAQNEPARFATLWAWTRDHLQRPDGLFAWHWQNGRVVDDSPAADADVDIALALTRAATQFDEPTYRAEAQRIADAVLEHETTTVDRRLVLVAGPWAVAEPVVNPSYLAPCDYEELAAVTGDARWAQLRDDSLALLAQLIDGGLPPDWLVLDPDGEIEPIASPDDRNGDARYGLDAARVPARLAACSAGHNLAATLWERLRTLDDDGAAVTYSLDGARLSDAEHPLGLIASALAATAAGDNDDAARLIDRAAALDDEHPTYYGAAWLALGEQLLAQPRPAPVGSLQRAVAASPVQEPSTTTDPPTTTAPPTTAPPPTTTAPPTTTPPTTTPATTTTSTTAGATTSPTTTDTTTTAPSTATTTGSAPPSTVLGSATTTTSSSGASTTTSSEPDPTDSTGVTGAPAGSDTPTDNSSADDTGTARVETGDLSGNAVALDELDDQHAAVDRPGSPTEQSRRRIGGLVLGGFAGITALGAVLGLRERVVVRRRPG